MRKVDWVQVEEYYNTHIRQIGMPNFRALNWQKQFEITKTRGYAYYAWGIAIEKFKEAIKKALKWL